MTDHASKLYLKRNVTMRELFSTLCESVCKLPAVAMIKRYKGYRRAGFAFWPAFWMSANRI